MKMIGSTKKALEYLQKGKVFKLLSGRGFELYGLEGKNGTYEIKYDITRDQWSCNCKNVRLTDCSHIKACIIKREQNGSNSTNM